MVGRLGPRPSPSPGPRVRRRAGPASTHHCAATPRLCPVPLDREMPQRRDAARLEAAPTQASRRGVGRSCRRAVEAQGTPLISLGARRTPRISTSRQNILPCPRAPSEIGEAPQHSHETCLRRSHRPRRRHDTVASRPCRRAVEDFSKPSADGVAGARARLRLRHASPRRGQAERYCE